MEIAETITPRRKLACLTIDFETDYGARLGKTFNILSEEQQLASLSALYRELEVPVSAFIRTDLLLDHPSALPLVKELANDFHSHSHTHDTANFDSAYELRTSQETFEKAFGRPALGYRAPLGMLHRGDVSLLVEHGFRFSSSVFPVLFPGRYNHRTKPLAPFVWKNGLVELPLAAVRGVRLTVALSFLKLFGLSLNRLLFKTFGLPDVVVLNSHLHDYVVSEPSFRALPPRLRLAWGINKHRGMRYCAEAVRLLRRRGYEFITMTELYEHVQSVRTAGGAGELR